MLCAYPLQASRANVITRRHWACHQNDTRHNRFFSLQDTTRRRLGPLHGRAEGEGEAGGDAPREEYAWTTVRARQVSSVHGGDSRPAFSSSLFVCFSLSLSPSLPLSLSLSLSVSLSIWKYLQSIFLDARVQAGCSEACVGLVGGIDPSIPKGSKESSRLDRISRDVGSRACSLPPPHPLVLCLRSPPFLVPSSRPLNTQSPSW